MTITQRAVLIRAYGGTDVAKVAEIVRPAAGPGQVLVRVRAAGVKLSKVVGFDDVPAAIERNRTGPRIGKIVAVFSL